MNGSHSGCSLPTSFAGLKDAPGRFHPPTRPTPPHSTHSPVKACVATLDHTRRSNICDRPLLERPGVDGEVRKGEVAGGPSARCGSGRLEAAPLTSCMSRADLSFATLKKKKNLSRPHEKVIMSGKKVLKIYALFKDSVLGRGARGRMLGKKGKKKTTFWTAPSQEDGSSRSTRRHPPSRLRGEAGRLAVHCH